MMRPPRLFVLAISATLGLSVVAVAPAARAETAEARQGADVFATPGEQSRVVARVRAGDEMTVLSRSGRWLKVRVNGRTGWVPRSVVATEEKAPERRRRSSFVEGRPNRDSGKASAPRDRIGADATADEEGFVDDEDADDEEDPDRDATGSVSRKVRDRDARERESRRDGGERERESDAGEEVGDEADDAEAASDDGGEESDEADDEADGEDDGERRRGPVKLVVVANGAGLFADPSARSDRLARLRAGTWVTEIGRESGWVHVRRASGSEGWIRDDDVDESMPFRYEKWSYSASAGLGIASVSQTFQSDSTLALGNYTVGSNALAIGINGEVVRDLGPSYLATGDLSYTYAVATPGIRCTPETCGGADAVNIGFKTHDLDLGASFGYKIWKETGLAVSGRLGYHYGMLKVNNVEDMNANPARLPTEKLQGVTLGVHGDLPRIWDRWAFHAGLDALVLLASREQTSGLEDGDVSDAFAMWFAARAIYSWKDKLKATGQLSYGYAKTNWTGRAEESQRQHDATQAVRSDRTILLLLGVERPF